MNSPPSKLATQIREQEIIVDELKTLKKIGGAEPRVYSYQPKLLFKSSREAELVKAEKNIKALKKTLDSATKTT